ncbi:MAG: shikimate kinase [Candidatus Lokiarchaeota archaeon]|nr:shikimate kinase [Candidatus Lokiarchaeota archaeon]
MKNIVLIGFMGTGKTVIGEKLAKKLNMDFIELDKAIEEKSGKSIPEIFSQDGEIRFREWEIQLCKETSEKQNVIVACGGGVVLNKINIDYFKRNGIIICLKSTPEVILKRTMKDGKEKRPLLNNPDPKATIKQLLEFREPFYNAAADYIIDTNKDIDTIIKEIIKILE